MTRSLHGRGLLAVSLFILSSLAVAVRADDAVVLNPPDSIIDGVTVRVAAPPSKQATPSKQASTSPAKST